MKFIVSTSALLKHLLSVNGVVGKNPVLPILEDILFILEKGKLTVSATDLETTMSTNLPVESKEHGLIAVPARKVIETLKNLPEQPVTFSLDPKTFSIEIHSDNGKYKAVGENGQDFPKIPEKEDTTSVEVEASVLEKAIAKTIFAASTDSLRLAITGIYFRFRDGLLTLVSTDAHRLVRFEKKGSTNEMDTSFIIPKKALQILKNALTGFTDKVKIDFNKSNAFFQIGNLSFICRLIDEKYPDYEAIIPVKNEKELQINRLDLLNCLNRISIYSNEATRQVKFEITGSQMKIQGEDLDYSSEANERLNCQYNGEDMVIAFNAKLLIDMLSNLDSREVVFKLSQPDKAGIIKDVDNEEPTEDITMLIMPVQFNG
ncbi:MAG: DNA polymerase III subunit beta [Bacteroidetes bacterium RIFCSPLOWO2_02_FULL_36_8]|nr:MAG: DNA polymerase III subunit beta [Bacteroidetes bacterium RIFCSPLOWO2_02_FULL_36_8]OFY70770.1 MAG: DNA polymerase III subunit beta [Bacteroidetes bacterium RIFCSPLOWO2_12_FULL_37_12]